MLQTTLFGKKLKNPFILASGILGSAASTLIEISKQAGAVTCKSVSKDPIKGHENPTVLAEEYVINAVGLSNPGVHAFAEELEKAIKNAHSPVIVSVVGKTKEEFVYVAERLNKLKPFAFELNLSCPNVGGKIISTDPNQTAEIVRAVKEVSKVPVLAKLTPNVSEISEIAKAAEDAGADGITAINTPKAMIIDARARMPILTNKFGGLSGKYIKPIALAKVYEIRRAVRIPIIGVGGITTGMDAAEMLMAGANAVGIGSAFYYRGYNAISQIAKELEEFMKREGYKKIEDIKMKT
ncbi:MAG: dihydroorotate dehydrogenase [Candidatus Anstonellales archaeon]